MSKKSPELFVQAPVSTNTPAVESTSVHIPTAIKPAEHVFFTVVPTAPQSTEHFVPGVVYISTAPQSTDQFVPGIVYIPTAVESAKHFVPGTVYIPTAVESAKHFVTSIFIIPATVESA